MWNDGSLRLAGGLLRPGLLCSWVWIASLASCFPAGRNCRGLVEPQPKRVARQERSGHGFRDSRGRRTRMQSSIAPWPVPSVDAAVSIIGYYCGVAVVCATVWVFLAPHSL
ncbi:hypothetical protein BD414DRAFT_498285 [Trametes punicea]|nr:hypothetical protein BD414DRAFT_498285 [Trametes punicea]